jgi:Ca2+-binding EF-hand superfamily protein
MLESSNKLLELSGTISILINLITVHRLFPKKVELQALIKFYDIDGDGNVSYEEFLSGLR